ncbi:MAG: hypothetical protein ABTQ34_05130 [Bdellovibrionales bacterium]
MDNAQTTTQGNTTWWITSLAISVVCCAILFVVFAGYLFGFREKLLVVETKLSMVEQRNAQLSMEIDNLHRRAPIQHIQVMPSNIPQQYMQPMLPPSEANAGEKSPPIVGVPAPPANKEPSQQQSQSPASQMPHAGAPSTAMPPAGQQAPANQPIQVPTTTTTK